MKIYIATQIGTAMPFNTNGRLVGVFDSYENAKAGCADLAFERFALTIKGGWRIFDTNYDGKSKSWRLRRNIMCNGEVFCTVLFAIFEHDMAEGMSPQLDLFDALQRCVTAPGAMSMLKPEKYGARRLRVINSIVDEATNVGRSK